MFHLGQPFCVSAVMPGMKPQARAIPSFIISYPIKNQGDQTYRLITAVLLAYSEPTINIFITKTCSIWGDIFVSPQSCLASMVDPKETLLSSILLQFWSPGHQKNRLIESDRLIYSSLAFEYTPLKMMIHLGSHFVSRFVGTILSKLRQLHRMYRQGQCMIQICLLETKRSLLGHNCLNVFL